MLYELWDYSINIRNRDRSDTHIDIAFTEMSIKALNTYSVVQSYETLVQTHIMSKWGFLTDNMPFRPASYLYRSRKRELNNMSPANRDSLYNIEVGNEDSEFGWSAETVRE